MQAVPSLAGRQAVRTRVVHWGRHVLYVSLLMCKLKQCTLAIMITEGSLFVWMENYLFMRDNVAIYMKQKSVKFS